MTAPWSKITPKLLLLAFITTFTTSCGPISDEAIYEYYDPYRAPSFRVAPTTNTYGEQPKLVSTSPYKVSSYAAPPARSLTKSTLGHQPGPKNFRTVIIDAGHGGRDTGAYVAGVAEKTLALDVARRIKRKLDSSFKVVFIRNGDYFVDLDRRVRATKPFNDAILISIHLNHGTSKSLRGPETYYFRVDSYSLAKRIQRNLTSVSPSQRSRGLVRRRLRLTRNTEIPSVLVELGYLSNSTDRALLSTSSYRDRLARAISNAVKSQNKEGDRGMGRLPAPLNRPPSRPSDSSEL